MKECVVVLAPAALDDLKSMRDWYQRKRGDEAASQALLEVLEHVDHLADHPRIGRMVPEFEQPDLRELVRGPLRVVYRLEAGEAQTKVQIVRFWQSARPMRYGDVE